MPTPARTIFITLQKRKTGNLLLKELLWKGKRIGSKTPYSANGLGKKCPSKGLKLEKNPAWKGGVTYWRKHGNYKPIKYVRCPKEYLPMARKDGYVMEHRLIVAQSLGICLERTQVVHHINHDPQDNRLENLMLFQSNKEHKLYEGQELKKLNTQGIIFCPTVSTGAFVARRNGQVFIHRKLWLPKIFEHR